MIRYLKRLRDLTIAFAQGAIDAYEQGGELSFGRTHMSDLDWNDAYDRGANFGEALHARIGAAR